MKTPLPTVCRLLGRAIPNEARPCPSCKRKGVRVPVHTCALPGIARCTQAIALPGISCCADCDQHSERVAVQDVGGDERREFLPGVADPIPERPLRLAPGNWATRAEVRDRHVQAFRELLAMDFPPPVKAAGEGILYVGGGKYWPMLVVALRMAREVTDLPIQVWHRGKAEAIEPADVADLASITFHDSTAVLPAPRVLGGWEAKAIAMLGCGWERFLFLDADAYLVGDPRPLLEMATPETPLVYWQDMPDHDDCVGWRWYGIDAAKGRAVPCIQGGQIAVHRAAAWRELCLYHWLNQHSDYFYHHPRDATLGHERHGYGDQDQLRAAFAATGGKFRCLGRAPWQHPAFVCPVGGKPVIVHRPQGKMWAASEALPQRTTHLPGDAAAWRHYDRACPNYSRIEEGLWAGGHVAAPPPGAAAVLNLCERPDPYTAEYHEQHFVPDDHRSAPSLDWLKARVDWVKAQRAAGRTVYVHCWGGVSRSGLVTVAYLMRERELSRDAALALARQRRPVLQPNPAFMTLLAHWEAELLAGGTAGEVFTRIYQRGLWGHGDRSGGGSTAREAAPYLETINSLIRLAGWKRVVDLGCGDGYVTSRLGAESVVGIDVYGPHLDALRRECPSRDWLELDFMDAEKREKIPAGDVLLAKDVLQHVPNAAVAAFIAWARHSGKWRWLILTNDCEQGPAMADCPLGGFRALDPGKEPLHSVPGLRVLSRYLHKSISIVECG